MSGTMLFGYDVEMGSQDSVGFLEGAAELHERFGQPTPFSEQPFFFSDQGFPDLLAIGIQVYQNRSCWVRFDDRTHGNSYQHHLFAMVEDTARNGWIWNLH